MVIDRMEKINIKCLSEEELELEKYYTVRGLNLKYRIDEMMIYIAIHGKELSAFKNCKIDKYGNKNIINKWYIEDDEKLKRFIEKYRIK